MKTELEIAKERILELEEQVKKLTSNTVLPEVFSGRDEDDSLAIEEAKTIWKAGTKLDAVKRLMRAGWGLKVAHDYCLKNFG